MKKIKFDTVDQLQVAIEYFTGAVAQFDKVNLEIHVEATDEEVADFVCFFEELIG